MRPRFYRPALLAALIGTPHATAQTTPNEPGVADDIVVVVGEPLGDEIAVDRIASPSSRLSQEDLQRSGAADLLGAIDAGVSGVSLNQAQGNAFQPSLTYRGFEASPLQGNAQGIAVYLDGARYNQAFGDTVDWDVLPDIAIDHVEVLGPNPAFGLNALGGAVNVALKSAFDHQGASLELSGGSFGRVSAAAEAGAQAGDIAIYAALAGLDEDGWRDVSPSSLRHAYVDLGWRHGRGEYRASLLAADNDLTGNGTTPIELLAVDRSAVFTHPDQTLNETIRLSLSGDWDLDDAWTLRARLHGGQLDRRSYNGDAAEVEPCEDDPDFLCGEGDDEDEDGPILTDLNGDPIANFITDSPYAETFPDFDEGGPYAFLNQSRTRTDSYGASARAIRRGDIAGMPHQLSFGASIDNAQTRFSAGSTLGGLSLDRGWFGPGVDVDAPDAGVNPVAVDVQTQLVGLFVSDAIDLTPDLTLNLSARADWADVELRDQIGAELDGDHGFHRINPAIGLVWRATPSLTTYAGYAESSRAPTPAELSCADADAPCSLANFFVADPPLSKVVGHTWDAGLRGRAPIGETMRLRWQAGAYLTNLDDDIQIVASEVAGRGYFQNVGDTRRSGLDASAQIESDTLTAFLQLAWTRATYETGFALNAAGNPAFEDEDDLMFVEPGDHRPGVPEFLIKSGVDVAITNRLSAGMDAQWSGGRYLVGDEANLNPRTDSYVIASAHVRHQFSDNLEVFASVENLFDTDYETFGAFSPVDEVPILQLPDISNPRALSPGAPRAVFVGLRWRS